MIEAKELSQLGHHFIMINDLKTFHLITVISYVIAKPLAARCIIHTIIFFRMRVSGENPKGLKKFFHSALDGSLAS